MRHIAVAVLCANLLISTAVADGVQLGPPVILLWGPGGQGYGEQTSVYESTAYTLGYDGERCTAPWGWSDSYNTVWARFWREAGVDGWNAVTAWCSDQYLPIPARGASIIVGGTYAWQGLSYRYGTFSIYYAAAAVSSPGEWRRTLRLVSVPSGVTYSGPYEWDLPLAATKLTYQLASLPAYKTDDPLTSYRFEIEILHVPEPSSLAAVLAGLVGFGAMLRRRRR